MWIKNRDDLLSHGDVEGKRLALDILEGGLDASDPYQNTLNLIRIEGDRLLVGGQPGMDVSGYGDEEVDLSQIKNIYVIGAGKAVQRQAAALEGLLGDRLTAGAISVKQGEGCHLRRIEVTEASHPVPDENSVAGARRVFEIARSAGPDDLVFTVFSDGASSLFTMPMPGLGLDDVQQVFRLGIKFGSQRLIIQAQPYYSAVSSGRLLPIIKPARSINLIMQVGLYPRWHGKLPETGSFVPSWPAAPQRLPEAAAEFKKLPWWNEFTAPYRRILEEQDRRYEVPDRSELDGMRFSFWQPIDLYQMAEGARAKAESLGLNAVVLCADLHALSSSAAAVLADVARECDLFGKPFMPPVAIITGGHLDVPVGDATGVGGRNQEFALLWGKALHSGRLHSPNIVVAAMDSDGTDGPGGRIGPQGEYICMAGGVVDSRTLDSAAKSGVDVPAHLANHDVSTALMRLKSAIYTGNTGTCLGDLRVAIVRRQGPGLRTL